MPFQRVTELPKLPKRPKDGHKGTFGHVLIIAGSRGMSGAACLCGLAALRSGSGLVSLAVPESVQPIVAGFEPSYLVHPVAEDESGRIDERALEQLVSLAEEKDAVALGPGFGKSEGLRRLAGELYRTLPCPLVVDADGLNLLSEQRSVLADHAGPRILTPHPGEFARLTDTGTKEVQADRERRAAEFAGQHGVVLVLKGSGTVVTDGERLAINQTGNSGMATGGTGDVLTGITASLTGQQLQPFEAAQLAAHLHGLAGDLAAVQLSEPGLIASDVAKAIPDAWRQWLLST